MHIPSRGFIIFKVVKGNKRIFFHGLSTLLLAKDGVETDEVLTEICRKLSLFDKPTYYRYELYDKPINIQILSDSKQKLDS